MKSVKELILLLGMFLIFIIIILFYFISEYKANMVIDKALEIGDVVRNLDADVYSYKNGVLLNSDGDIVDTSIYLEASGKIGYDKYGHISYNLLYGNKYICKTALGKLDYTNKCNGYDLDVKMNRNNYQISFEIGENIDEYMISEKDDFSGVFKSIDVDGENFILNLDNVGTYYIWFKDKYGNLSEVIEYSAECLSVLDEEYSNKILYCPGSVISLYEEKYIVLNDKSGKLDLMRLEALDEKLSHCTTDLSYCYFNSEEDMKEYSWSNSYINYYLNEVYYNSLNEELKNMIVLREICDNYSGTNGCDNDDGCGGYKKEVMLDNEWACERDYVDSKIRLLSYDEYVYLIDNSKNKIVFNDYFHLINSSNESMKNQSVLSNGDVYTKENAMEKLSVRPVFTIEK